VERVVASDGCGLAAHVHGNAGRPAVLLLHSIGCDAGMWAQQAASLRDGYRVIGLDLRGHGASDAPPGDYTLERLGRDAAEVLDAVGAASVHVCGLSLGGVVAQWMAVHRPERMRTLTLANTTPRIGTPEAWSERAALVRREGTAAIADVAMGRFFGESFRKSEPEVVERTRARLLATSAEGYAGCCAALRDADLAADVGQIAAPTLLIGGRYDVSTPPEQIRALAGPIKGARYLELDAAHLSNLERPQAFTQALINHLEQA
jgi:3-oxoadipate enol-lactonase